MKSTALKFTALSAGVILLAGCTAAGGNGGGNGAGTETAVLKIGAIGDVASWDPAQAHVGHSLLPYQVVYDSLLLREPDGTLSPMLATEWEYDEARTTLTLDLRDASGHENPDVLAGLARTRRPGQTIVGFAAETASGDELRERGRRKRERKGADLLVVNRVGWSEGFESEENSALLLAEDAETETSGSKRQVADAVWDAVLGLR